METLFLDEILKATCGQTESRDKTVKVKGVSTDSRTIMQGDLFFAVKGDRFDGHDFITKALTSGASGVVVSNEFKLGPGNDNTLVIRVKDTTTALGDLAKYYRKKLDTKVVGITGSNGKTTTKEMTYHVLSRFGSASRSIKSFNNFIGVPVTIFGIEKRHQYGVLEMGTNAPGEIRRLSEIGAPDVAVIVNISKTHLEGLKDIEGVARAKAEILENLSKDGVFVYNADNPWCVKIAGDFRGETMSFGFSPRSHIKCTGVEEKDGGYTFEINGHLKIPLPVPGEHNIMNCLASFAVCKAFGHDIGSVSDAFTTFKLPDMRIEQQRVGNITVINDAYNANPESVRAALRYLSGIDTTGRKVFICGDMLELGSESEQLHREIGESVAKLRLDLLWTVGNHASEISKAAKSSGMPETQVVSFKEVSEITASDVNELRDDDIVLIKGSRGMHMENIIEKLRRYCPKQAPVHN